MMQVRSPQSVPHSEFRTLGSFWRAARGFSLPVSVLPVLVATAAVLPFRQWRWDVMAACLAGVGLLHAAGNMLNDYFDFRKGVDHPSEGNENRPGFVLVRGGLAPRDILIEAILCIVLAAAAAGFVLWRSGPGVLYFLLPALAAIYAYTGPPFVLKYRALGELVIFPVFGPLVFLGAAWAQTGRFELAALYFSIPLGLATTAVLVGNNFRDRREDAEAGIRTIGTIARGGIVACIVYVATVVGAVVGLTIMASESSQYVLFLAPFAILLLWKPLLAILRGERLADIDDQTAKFVTVLMILSVVACLVQPPAFAGP
jgi:1,4-dihydroxy-2-naphthoate polyprenyltransferase